MTSQKIRVLIVDDFADTRESISKLLYFEKDIEVVGLAPDGREAVQKARELRPDVILMDINMPGMDGISAAEVISATVPESAVIMMSVQGEPDYLRRAMLAGAREYLVKPFTGDELAGSIRHVFKVDADKRTRIAATPQPNGTTAPESPVPSKTGRMITLFSPKGGVGRTTVATNLAIALHASTGKRVALVDGNLLFGDIAIMLNLPTSKTISDLIPNIGILDLELLEGVMAKHESGIRVLLAPPRPELAELISGDHLRVILNLLKSHYDYIVMDTHPGFEDTMLTALDISDHVLLLTTLEMPAIKNMKLFLEVAEALSYPPEKLMLVLNRSDSTGGIRVQDVEQNIRFKVSASIVSAGQLMASAVNQGVPVVMSNRDSAISKNIFDLARLLMKGEDVEAARAGEVTERAGRDSQQRKPNKFGIPALSFLGSRKGGD